MRASSSDSLLNAPGSQQPLVDISNAGLVVCVADIFDFSGSLARYVRRQELLFPLICLLQFSNDLLPSHG